MQDDDAPLVIDGGDERFDRFVRDIEPRLRRALVAAYGLDAGQDATADALAWAWEHFDRVESMRNGAGYLYRVGQTAARKGRRWSDRTELRIVDGATDAVLPVEPELGAALRLLTPRQRSAVLLVDGWGYTLAEAAAAMGCRVPTVRTHHRRALTKLRTELGVEP